MDKIEAVKAVLIEETKSRYISMNIQSTAEKICQLFEPKPSKIVHLRSPIKVKKIKPSEGRLLTAIEIGNTLDLENENRYTRSDGSETWCISVDKTIKAQDAKTASMFQQRLDDIYRRIAEQGIIGNYNATGKYLCDLSPLLQALKKQEILRE